MTASDERNADPLTHMKSGSPGMVPVGEKPVTERIAVAEGFVRINAALESAIRADALAKGDLLSLARLAGIMAAKRTDELIPLCHSLPLDSVDVTAELVSSEGGSAVRLQARVAAHARTGVEMEALTAVAVAALTVVDMGKSIDRSMTIEGIRLLEKHGGRRGSYVAEASGRAL